MEALIYLTGELNYGGRVTDANDRRLVKSLLKTFYCDEVLNTTQIYRFSTVQEYYIPTFTHYEDYVEYISSLPSNTVSRT
jgi:dynein heavy chain